MENFESSTEADQEARRREIGLRAKRRALKDREYQICAVITGTTAYVIFTLCMSAIGFFSNGILVGAAIPLIFASGLSYTIYSIWRPSKWRPIMSAIPVVLFVLLEAVLGGWSDKPFWLADVGLGGIFYLWRVRQEIAAVPN